MQPLAGRVRDTGRLRDGIGMATGLVLAGAGIALAATIPAAMSTATSAGLAAASVIAAAVLVGAGVGLATPLESAHLAAGTRPERPRQTMGSAEVGRELGDAGGLLLVGALATAISMRAGYLRLAAVLLTIALTVARSRTPRHAGA